jgi:putative ABC transport system permease protein
MGTLLIDVRYAMRMLRVGGATTAFAIATLALGIGATTALFSLINAVLLRPLPYPEADRLVVAWQHVYQLGLTRMPVSLPEFLDYQRQAGSFAAMAIVQPQLLTREAEYPEQLQAASVSAGFFRVLGTDVARGRTFLDSENEPGREHVAIVTDGFWRERLGGDPAILDRRIVLNGAAYAVVGVLHATFRAPGVARVELLVPAPFRPEAMARRNARNFRLLARLKPGVTTQSAHEELQAIVTRNAEIAGLGSRLVPLHEEMVGDVQRPLLLTLTAVGVVLLIACANVANLSLARTAARGRELSVRAAIGASRATLVRQLLTESLLLSVLAGAVGLLLAFAMRDFLIQLSPPNLPRVEETRIDQRVLLFSGALSILTGLMFGLAPAWHASRANVVDTLKEEGMTASTGPQRRHLRRLLVAFEVALAVVLLVCAGLVVRSFARLIGEDSGFQMERVLSAVLELPAVRYPDQQRRDTFFEALLERIRNVSGVEHAAVTNALPLAGSNADFGFVIQGRPQRRPDDFLTADWRVTSPDYFRVLGIPLRRGRYFGSDDRPGAAPVVIVNEAMARTFWPDEDPIGRQIKLGRHDSPLPVLTIVGIVGDVRHHGLHRAPRPEMYLSYRQMPEVPAVFRFPPMTLVVRHQDGVDASDVVRGIRDAVRELDPRQALGRIASMETLLADSVASRRFSLRLFVLFAALALLMAAIGVYGVVSSWVRQRVREIGIRIAIGAERRDVLHLILGEAMKVSSVGALIGVAAAAAAARLMGSLLYETSMADPLTFASAPLLMASVTLGACWAPAWQAATIDPSAALRFDLQTFPGALRRRASVLRTRMSEAIDRALNRSPVDVPGLASAIAATAGSARTLEEHAALAADVIRTELQIESLTLFVRDERTGDYVAITRQPHLPDANALTLARDALAIRRLQRLSAPLTVNEAELETWLRSLDNAPPSVREARRLECETLRTAGSVFLFPVWIHDEMVGVLGVGPSAGHAHLTASNKWMVSSIAGQIAFVIENARLMRRIAEQDRLRREVEIAATVQRRLFPQQPPRVDGFQVAGTCLPAREVGGDYYDYFALDDGEILLAVADVAGKGLGPALVMSSVQAALRTIASPATDLSEMAARMNRLLCESTAGNSYATLFCARLDPMTRRLTYVNAGHCPPVVCRFRGNVCTETMLLQTGGPVVGLFTESVYREGTVNLRNGDLLVVYTDGVSEAMNGHDEEFGEARLLSAVIGSSHVELETLCADVLRHLRQWRGQTPQYDDQTLLFLRAL